MQISFHPAAEMKENNDITAIFDTISNLTSGLAAVIISVPHFPLHRAES